MKQRVMMTLGAGAIALFAVVITGAPSFNVPAKTPEHTPSYLSQIGPHALAAYNVHEPLVNIAKTWNGEWTLEMRDGSIMSAAELREIGAIRESDGMPSSMPEGGKVFLGPVLFGGARYFPDYYADNYVMTWKGEGYGFLYRHPSEMQTRTGSNKLTFTTRFDDPSPRQVRFSQLGKDGISALTIFRSENQNLADGGMLWNPRHLENLRHYDIIRTMDYQFTNGSPVTRFEQVATPDDAAWGTSLQLVWPAPLRYGLPFEIIFDLAKETETALWLNIPPMIGAPFHLADPALRADGAGNEVDMDKVRARARVNVEEILASPVWEIFAGELIDRMIASGYPPDRKLYLELGNEIWNTSGWFGIHSNYAWGIGTSQDPDWGLRHGYGILSARWATAFDTELKKRGRKQNVTYVLAGQTAWPGSSELGITGFTHQLDQSNRNDIHKNTGIAVTSYHGCFEAFARKSFGILEQPSSIKAFEDAIDKDRAALSRALHDFCVNGSEKAGFTKKWVLSQWHQHEAIAKKAGIGFIGAYEGGPDDGFPGVYSNAPKIRKFWADYLWGPDGADVARQINQAITDEFPGVILSNYIGIGPVGGPPWGDGGYDDNTPIQQMWREYSRQERYEIAD